MARIGNYDDVFAVLMDAETVEKTPPALLYAWLRELAIKSALVQYEGRPPRLTVHEDIDWLITGDVDEVERFQPAHDCETCREANVAIAAALRDQPGKIAVLGNLHYTEVWT